MTGANWDPRFEPGGHGWEPQLPGSADERVASGGLFGVQSPIQGPETFTMPGSVGAKPENYLDNTQYEEATKELKNRRRTRDEAYKHLMDNHYPTMKDMKWDSKKDIAPLLLSVVAALTGQQGQEFAGGLLSSHLGGRREGVDRENQRAIGLFNAQQDQGALAAKIAQQGVNDAQDDIEGLIKQENLKASREDRALARQDRIVRDQAMQQDRDDRTLTGIDRQYQLQTTFNGMMSENARKGTVTGGVPLPREQVEDDYLQKSLLMNQTPVKRYLDYISNFDKTRGFVPDKDMPKVESMRAGTLDALAGTDPVLRAKAEAILNKLMPVPSQEKTLVWEKQQENIRLGKEKMAHVKVTDATKIANMKARTQIAAFAAQTARANYENALDNTSLRAYEIAQKESDKATQEYNDGVKEQLKWYEDASKVAGAQAEYETQRAADAAAAGIKDPAQLPYKKMSNATINALSKWNGLKKQYPKAANPGMPRLDLIQGAKELGAWKNMEIKDMPAVGQRGMPAGPQVGNLDGGQPPSGGQGPQIQINVGGGAPGQGIDKSGGFGPMPVNVPPGTPTLEPSGPGMLDNVMSHVNNVRQGIVDKVRASQSKPVVNKSQYLAKAKEYLRTGKMTRAQYDAYVKTLK